MNLAIIATHPIQYHAPWFAHLAKHCGHTLKVFYLWDFGVTERVDPNGFQTPIRWDIPLLSGYDHTFVPNVSRDPGTHHFWGLRNPALMSSVADFRPDAVLLLAYNFASTAEFIFRWNRSVAPLLFRGDSHRLVPQSGLQAALNKRLIAALYSRFSACLYVGRANKDYFRIHGVAEDKLFFVPHGVDNERFMRSANAAKVDGANWRRELGIPAECRVVLFAGKFERKKRPVDLLQAFLRVAHSDEILLMVGSGPLERNLRTLAGNSPAVKFAPFQNQSMMPRTYAAADLFVLSSFGPGETWGLAVNEAMCMGLPIIASSHVGCVADLVRPHVNGLIFPAGDVSSLGGAIRDALSDTGRLEAWGSESKRLVSGYSFEAMASGLEAALRHVLKGKVSETVRPDQIR